MVRDALSVPVKFLLVFHRVLRSFALRRANGTPQSRLTNAQPRFARTRDASPRRKRELLMVHGLGRGKKKSGVTAKRRWKEFLVGLPREKRSRFRAIVAADAADFRRESLIKLRRAAAVTYISRRGCKCIVSARRRGGDNWRSCIAIASQPGEVDFLAWLPSLSHRVRDHPLSSVFPPCGLLDAHSSLYLPRVSRRPRREATSARLNPRAPFSLCLSLFLSLALLQAVSDATLRRKIPTHLHENV